MMQTKLRPRVLMAAIATLALGVLGCGGSSQHPAVSRSVTAAQTAVNPEPFAWLAPAPAPSTWSSVAIANGSSMAFPPGWHRIHGDPGTATVVLSSAHNRYLGYLNLTPRQSSERLSNWASFRVRHNAKEGDRHLRTLTAATGLRFRNGHGSCVKDSYFTISGLRFIEVACLVSGAKSTSVIVGAAPPATWNQVSPTIERAISAVLT